MTRDRRRPAFMLAACLAVSLALSTIGAFSSGALAALRERPDRTWMTDGKVFALVRVGNMLILGGRFMELLPPRGSAEAPMAVSNLAALDIETGRPLQFAPKVGGAGAEVRALAFADGRLYVGGSFSSLGGSAAGNIGAIRIADSSRISSFNPAVRGPVYALVATVDRLYAGGAFGRVDGAPRARLAAWDMPAGDLSPSWRPQTSSGAVRDLEFDASGTSVFIAGAFDAMAQAGTDLERRTLAKVDAGNGRVLDWRPDGVIGDPQTAWAVDVTRRRVHGGFGRGPNYTASFEAGGAVGNRIWRSAATGNVQAVELSDDGSRLYVGGHFGLNGRRQPVCGSEARGLVALDPDTGAPICAWLPRLAPFDHNYHGPWAMVVTRGGLWVAGGWLTIDGLEQRNIARFSS